MVDVEFNVLTLHLQGLMRSPYIQILFWLICFDVVSGYIKAFKLKKFDSKTSTNGLLRHFLVISVVMIVALYARALNHREIGITTCLFHYELCGVVDGELGSVGLTIPRSVETVH